MPAAMYVTYMLMLGDKKNSLFKKKKKKKIPDDEEASHFFFECRRVSYDGPFSFQIPRAPPSSARPRRWRTGLSSPAGRKWRGKKALPAGAFLHFRPFKRSFFH